MERAELTSASMLPIIFRHQNELTLSPSYYVSFAADVVMRDLLLGNGRVTGKRGENIICRRSREHSAGTREGEGQRENTRAWDVFLSCHSFCPLSGVVFLIFPSRCPSLCEPLSQRGRNGMDNLDPPTAELQLLVECEQKKTGMVSQTDSWKVEWGEGDREGVMGLSCFYSGADSHGDYWVNSITKKAKMYTLISASRLLVSQSLRRDGKLPQFESSQGRTLQLTSWSFPHEEGEQMHAYIVAFTVTVAAEVVVRIYILQE